MGTPALVGLGALAPLPHARGLRARLAAWRARRRRAWLLRDIALDALARGDRAAALRCCDLLDGPG